MPEFEIDVNACRTRQRRVVEWMQEHDVSLVVLTQNAHVHYLSGVRVGWTFCPAAALSAAGELTLVTPNQAPPVAAADRVTTYEAQWHSTMRNDQRQASSAALLTALGEQTSAARIGVEFSSFSPHLAEAMPGALVDVEPELYRQRRVKDADELALIRQAIAGTEKMYQRAREIIAPGVNELHIFNELQAAAVAEFGEMLTGTGNDYQCGEKGGPPRDRAAEAGELYILDLGPAFRGYFADNCRTISVTGQPSDEQQAAWETIQGVFRHVEATVRPGKSCRELFEEAQALLDAAPVGVFDHHLGHGIGLFPHEAPHLNPNWDDTFQAGEVFTCEPGLYADQLRAGMRLENDYLVTESGVECLTPFPMEL